MRKFPRLLVWMGCLLTLFAEAASPEIQVRNHRFFSHTADNYERLVIEFTQRGGREVPDVMAAADGVAGEIAVKVSGANLKGAIPEAAVNDSYVSRSRYLGPITVNAEGAQGFSLRGYLKNPQSRVEAFWLTKPARLVVDVFPPHSPRASGLRPNRGTASRRGGKNRRMGRNDYLCFPASAAVGMKVTFETSDGGAAHSAALDTAGNEGDTAVVCYPKSAQVVASISFDPPKDVAPSGGTSMMEMSAPPMTRAPAPPSFGGAPANRYQNQSPQALRPQSSLALPSTGGLSLPPPGGSLALPPQGGNPGALSLTPAAPSGGLSLPSQTGGLSLPPPGGQGPSLSLPSQPNALALPSAPPANDGGALALPSLGGDAPPSAPGGLALPSLGGGNRAPTAGDGKPTLQLPMSLPPLPSGGTPAAPAPQGALSLPPAPPGSAPSLLPPLTK